MKEEEKVALREVGVNSWEETERFFKRLFTGQFRGATNILDKRSTDERPEWKINVDRKWDAKKLESYLKSIKHDPVGESLGEATDKFLRSIGKKVGKWSKQRIEKIKETTSKFSKKKEKKASNLPKTVAQATAASSDWSLIPKVI